MFIISVFHGTGAQGQLSWAFYLVSQVETRVNAGLHSHWRLS